ncbi:glutamate 5-kinase, partial [Gardnerella pickettii JCP7659]|uniref:glutamate 5-kinase n=2 Tax=Bifidobacteriaceae TaxID=31953 RepID=UPI0003532B5A
SISNARTIVVKVGSSSLTAQNGHLDVQKLRSLVDAISRAQINGAHVVLVSSGAIAAGFGLLGFDSRPKDVPTQQATASVGQGLLMAQYEQAFAKYGLKVGQMLLTADVTISPSRYRNAQRTMLRLLELGVVPIVNENDALSSNEIRFGDNDRLAALVANIVRADALVLLTDVDALYTAPPSEPGAKRIGFVADVTRALDDIKVGESGSGVGTGGMVTKMDAAHIAAVSGIPTLLTCASSAESALAGDSVGTVFAPLNSRASSRRLWIGFASNPHGAIIVDSGAAAAVCAGRASLLAAGIVGVTGDFCASDPVWIDDEHGNHLAKGLVAFDSDEIPQVMGLTTDDLEATLGRQYAHPVVHRDNLVLL